MVVSLCRTLAAVGLVLLGGCAMRETTEMLFSGDTDRLRERPQAAPDRSPHRPPLLIVTIDGVDRDLLYEMIRDGDLPHTARLLGGRENKAFPHAYFEPTTLSTLPSTTMAAWVTTFTGVGPGTHGVTGNELFVREEKRFVAPVPVSFSDLEPMLENYTDGYTNRASLVPSVFERMRKRDPAILIWASMLPYHRGADLLLKTDRGALLDALRAFVSDLGDGDSRTKSETLDEEATEAIVEELESGGPIPDVLAVYYVGNDQYAHKAEAGPDAARREYLKEALDPELGKLAGALEARKALANRWIVITSDHGHTEVVHDAKHALGTDAGDPPQVLERAGFRVRPFELEVDDDADFQAVLAYQGAMAYVYLADRSTCAKPGRACDWKRPPRFEEDVLEAADAFHRASRDGRLVPEMKGTLDMVLARRPVPVLEVDLPFEVYVGDGKLEPVATHLARNPRKNYVAVAERLAELAVGPAGERAGDVLLIANNGNRDRPEERYYFSAEYHSWHGSPCEKDSEIPLIVAHHGKPRQAIEAGVRRVLGARGRQRDIADLLLALRFGFPAPR